MNFDSDDILRDAHNPRPAHLDAAATAYTIRTGNADLLPMILGVDE